MELPIFQDNLRSSGGWATTLSAARDKWRAAVTQTPQLQARVRTYQIEQSRHLDEIGRDNFAAAAQLVAWWAAEPGAKLSAARLIELNRTLAGAEAAAGLWRKAEAAPLNESHAPPLAVMLPRLVENAFDWFSTEGFSEMNPVEQAALVYLRLLDMQPFATAQEPTALLAASFYTERAGLPPLIIPADDATLEHYNAALAAAFRMLTQPLIEFFADCLMRTINLMLAEQSDQ